VEGAERRTLSGEARSKAFAESRRCLEPILAALEPASAAPADRAARTMLAIHLAEALVEVGEREAADSLAEFELRDTDPPEAFPDGGVVYSMNSVRGRVALRRQDVTAAVRFLRRAGRTPGSPALNSFGPRFVLARELLEAGESAAVLSFLDDVGRFWTNPDAEAELASARRIIAAGGIPDDSRWW